MMQRTAILILFVVSVPMNSTAWAEVSPEQLRRLDAYLACEANRFHLPNVAVAIVEREEIVHQRVFGTRVTEDSGFIIGSCAKTVTALAALLALDEAGVDLDTPINKLLTKVRVRDNFTPPTPRQLLQHRSGLTRVQGFDALPSLQEVEEYGFSFDMGHSPGERFVYCNTNYSWLALIIEKVTGLTFCEFVHSRVFTPAGMTDSSCGTIPVSAAEEFQYCFGFPLRVAPTRVPAARIPSGFLRCSAHDLARLQLCLLHDGAIDGQQVFPAKLIQQMKTPAAEAEFGYGMGLANGYLDGLGRIIAHEGATPTSYAFHGALIEREFGIVFLTNINLYDPFTDHGETIYENMLRILAGQEPVTSYPYRIWVRWALIPIMLLIVWQAVTLLARWRLAGCPFHWPTTRRKWLSLASQLALPVGIWWLVLRWVEVPFLDVLRLDPDIMWSFLFLTATGMVTGVVKACGGEAVQPQRRRLAAKASVSPAPARETE